MLYALGLDIGDAAARDHRSDLRAEAARHLAGNPTDDYVRGVVDGYDRHQDSRTHIAPARMAGVA